MTVSFLYGKLGEYISFSTNLTPLIYTGMERLFPGVCLGSVTVGRETSAIGLALHTLPCESICMTPRHIPNPPLDHCLATDPLFRPVVTTSPAGIVSDGLQFRQSASGDLEPMLGGYHSVGGGTCNRAG